MVQASEALTVRTYARRDLTAVRDLAFYNYRAHTHLDWQTVYEYLQSDPERTWVVGRGDAVVGLLALSEPIGEACWLRLLFVHDDEDLNTVLSIVWGAAIAWMQGAGVREANVLMIHNWLLDWAADSGFLYVEHIVTLKYQQTDLPPPSLSADVEIGPLELEYLADVHALDMLTFEDPWRLTPRELRLGSRVGVYCTRAVVDGATVGYQIATTHGMHGHLARLGVHPEWRRRGIGGMLVWDMLRYFREHGVHKVTVNTQDSNIGSQRLYERFGFQRNGFDLPVWKIKI